LTITINEVLFSDGRGLAVFRASDEQGSAARYVAERTLFRCPAPGECWRVEFTAETHPQYGSQRRVTQGHLALPRGAFLVHLLAHHPALRGLGIGVVTANRLYRAHGSGLANLLTGGDPSVLPELSADIAFELCERWRALALEPAVVTWLDERGLEPHLASQIIALYGPQSIEAMETNPYCLLPFLSFERIDAFARARLGVAPLDARRLVAAVEAALYRSIDHGHTAMLRTHLRLALHSSLAQHADAAIELALSQTVAFARGQHVQAYAPAIMEGELEAWVRQIQNPAGTQSELRLLAGGESLAALVERQAQMDGAVLTEEQRQAVLGALGSRLYCILGGAGVGKTTVLRMLGKLITAVQGQACYMAISGRAARRIAEALGPELAAQCSVTTVAGYLKSVAPTLVAGTAPWLVVDEASMVDLQSAYRIITQSPVGLRLILVGDPAQLPPVGAGLFFHRLVAAKGLPRMELTRVFRHAEATGIPAVARAFRDGGFPDLPSFVAIGQGVQLHPASPETAIAEAIRIRDALAPAGSVQVLTLFRKAFGAAAVNQAMHARVTSGTPRLTYPFKVALGEPVIYTKNDPELDLQNGSLGVVTALDAEAITLRVRWDDAVERELRGTALLHCELAHGITTHKAQGSQYERVVVVVPRATTILDRALLYTAVTRARQQVVLVGDAEAMRAAVTAPSNAAQREVLFLPS
jgi:exodeoxyribonuclease V alpha subunit